MKTKTLLPWSFHLPRPPSCTIHLHQRFHRSTDTPTIWNGQEVVIRLWRLKEPGKNQLDNNVHSFLIIYSHSNKQCFYCPTETEQHCKIFQALISLLINTSDSVSISSHVENSLTWRFCFGSFHALIILQNPVKASKRNMKKHNQTTHISVVAGPFWSPMRGW